MFFFSFLQKNSMDRVLFSVIVSEQLKMRKSLAINYWKYTISGFEVNSNVRNVNNLWGTSAVIIGAKNFRMFKLKIKREQKMELNIFFVNYENIFVMCFHKLRDCLKILRIGGKDKKSQFRKKKIITRSLRWNTHLFERYVCASIFYLQQKLCIIPLS